MEFTDFVIITFHTQTQMAFVLTQLVWLGMVTQPGQFQQEIAVVIGHIHQHEGTVRSFLTMRLMQT